MRHFDGYQMAAKFMMCRCLSQRTQTHIQNQGKQKTDKHVFG